MSSEFVVTLDDGSGRLRDLTLTLPADATDHDVLTALGGRVEGTSSVWIERLGTSLVAGGTARTALLHGDILRVGHQPPAPDGPRLIHERTGAVHDLAARTVVGRGANGGPSLRLDDATVSSNHAVLSIEREGVWIRDEGSTNGTFVNGIEIGGERQLVDGDEIEFGEHSRFRFAAGQSGGVRTAEIGERRDGRVYINRPPRNIVQSPVGVTRVGPAPEARGRRRFPLPALLIPAVLALVLWQVADRDPTFLLFMLMSPLMLVWNYVDGRRDDSQRHAAAVKSFEESLDAAETELRQARESERLWFESVLPDSVATASRLESSDALWDRTPSHEDFGWVRVGTARLPPLRRIEIEQRGDPKYLERALELEATMLSSSVSPVHLNLISEPVVGFVGRGEQLDAAVSNAILRLAIRQPPADLGLTVLSGNPAWNWMRWLPHTSSIPGVSGSGIAHDAESSQALFEALDAIIDRRLKGHESAIGPGGLPLPHIVVLIAPPVTLPAPALTSFIERGRAVGISVIWVASTTSALPTSCQAIVEVGGTSSLTRPGSGAVLSLETVELTGAKDAESQARRLAPIVESGARGGALSMPRLVALCELNEIDPQPDPRVIQARWSRAPEQLAAPIGRTGEGPLSISFAPTHEGPHILVAGTTRAGKSEFLQALVAGLAANYSPERLNLLFVDWKGAATFRPFLGLPHTVGLLSDLDEGLADRALRSLKAELNYRKRVLDEAGVQKIDDLAPGTLPRLVVLFDEFAELVDSNKDFADGVVSVAQVGGSLGIHMVLAMQTPSGALNKKIENCINGRVVFRLKDRAESSAALDSPKAAEIPAAIPGRGYLKDGSNRLVEFQSAYGGLKMMQGDEEVGAHTVGAAVLKQALDGGITDLEHMTKLLTSPTLAASTVPRPPWVPPLPTELSLDELPAPQSQSQGSHRAAIGLMDDPDNQRQHPFVLDLSVVRNLLIAGSGGAGKTSALRTVVDAFARTLNPQELVAYGIDFGGGLQSLDAIPNVGEIVVAADSQKLRRLLVMMQSEIEQRRATIGDSGSAAAYRAAGNGLPTVLVLVDGLMPTLAELAELDFGSWMNALQTIMTDGPAVGVHVIASTNEPLLRSAVMNLFGERLVLRQTTKEGYSSLGVVGVPVTSTGAGRAISAARRLEVQLAVTAPPDSHDHADQIDGIRARWEGQPKVAKSVEVLPHMLDAGAMSVGTQSRGAIVVGLDDAKLASQFVDTSRHPTFAVAGPDLSGRTSTLAWLRSELARQGPLRSARMCLSGATASEAGWDYEEFGVRSIAERLDELRGAPFDGTTLIVFDDADGFFDMSAAASPEEREERKVLDELNSAMSSMLDLARESRTVVMIAGRLDNFARGQGWLKRVRESRQALVLSPTSLGASSSDVIFGVKYPRRTGYEPRPGLGVLVRGADTCLVQVPFVGVAD